VVGKQDSTAVKPSGVRRGLPPRASSGPWGRPDEKNLGKKAFSRRVSLHNNYSSLGSELRPARTAPNGQRGRFKTIQSCEAACHPTKLNCDAV